jgi:WD40 repeat protein
MSDQHKGAGELPEPPESYEEELMDEVDDDMEQESDDLKQLWQPIYEANQQSLERVDARLQSVQSTRQVVPSESPASHPSTATPAPTAKGASPMNTIKTTVPAPSQAPSTSSQRRSVSPSRLTTIAAVLATGLLLTGTLLGFLYFYGERPSHPGPTPQLSAKLLCHSTPIETVIQYSTDNNQHLDFLQTPLDWSRQGDISYAMPTAFLSGKTCATLPIAKEAEKSLSGGSLAQVAWSPDGSRLVFLARPAAVVDTATGRTIATLQGTTGTNFVGFVGAQFPSVGQVVWSPNGKQIIAVLATNFNNATGLAGGMQVREWDSQTGSLIRTALSFTNVQSGSGWISPNGAYFATLAADHSIQIWNIATGHLVSTTPPSMAAWVGTVAWSPDSAFFAFGISSARPSITPGRVRIISSATGQIVATLIDTDTFEGLGLVDGLAWSPNGEYLAETSGKITIWDTSTWQQVASFGAVITGPPYFAQVTAVTWSPDSSMLADVAGLVDYQIIYTNGATPTPIAPDACCRLYIWKLTPISAPTAVPATPTSLPATPTPWSGTPYLPTPTPPGMSTPTPVGPGTPTPNG